MSPYRIIDIETWNRKEHFNFFSQFEEPIYGITAEVDITIAYTESKKQKCSFYLYYLHKILSTVNQINVLKYRILEDKVVEYERINASATVNRDNETFGFSYIDFDENLDIFIKNANKEIENVRTTDSLFPEKNGDDVIHFSALPWIKFTSLSHARHFERKDSVPKITVGKMENKNDTRTMPISIHVHHALVDGVNIGHFFELLQQLLNQK
jgi:chloramphenicol O-acetyltransferase type A